MSKCRGQHSHNASRGHIQPMFYSPVPYNVICIITAPPEMPLASSSGGCQTGSAPCPATHPLTPPSSPLLLSLKVSSREIHIGFVF